MIPQSQLGWELSQRRKARSSDPITSHEAAASVSVGSVSELQGRIYRILQDHGPMTDTSLCEYFVGRQSSIRTRRNELVKKGKIVADGYGKTRSGRRAIKWRAVD